MSREGSLWEKPGTAPRVFPVFMSVSGSRRNQSDDAENGEGLFAAISHSSVEWIGI